FYASRLTGNITREFGYGSFGGYYNFDEAVEFLDELHLNYPEIVSDKQIIGYTFEDRPIYAVRMSDNPEMDEDEPEILYTGMHHAREPIGMMTLLYFMEQLAQGYGTDSEYTTIVDNRQLWFIPIVNPDGYEYNRQIAPNGGGMARKNRRPGCSNSQYAGVDLNRNYGFNWGWDNEGSSSNQCIETYRGTEAFSEPETQVISEFVLLHDFKITLNFHAYGNVLILPSGEIPTDLPPIDDLEILREFGDDMTQFNGYEVGSGMETLNYAVNGDTDAWMYNVAGIFSMTPEVGNSNDGFWPETDRIFPLVQENVYPNTFAAWAVGSKFRSEIELSSELFLAGLTYSFTPHIFNQGLSDSQGDVMVEIEVTGDVDFENVSLNAGPFLSREEVILDPFGFTVSAGAMTGQTVEFSVQVWDETGFLFLNTFEILLGQPTVIFSDDAEDGMTNWNTSTWGLSTDSWNGNYSFSDSPDGDYPELSSRFMNLALPLNLSDAAGAFITYYAKWDIEAGYDFAQVLASTNGTSWTPLVGTNMSPGSGNGMQPQGQFGYDGTSDWIADEISLDEFAGQPYVWLKFRLSSDTYVEGDGFYFDDLAVWAFVDQALVGDVNEDSNVDVLDIVMIVNFILNLSDPTPGQLLLADLNGDGQLNVLDVVNLVTIIING
ncbi:MAG: immune inhibitor A, partial [Candidatus Marinimicrobia bacterium]|nr:immune inhibitor A [Candidatus Neomarinimicrobiota bacterium]